MENTIHEIMEDKSDGIKNTKGHAGFMCHFAVSGDVRSQAPSVLL